MKACEKLLGLCPEILTAWNYRRETIEARTGDAATTSEGGDEGEGEGEGDWWSDELRVSETALRNNPKSYPSWYHRKWVLRRMIEAFGTEEGKARETLEREAKLCADMLNADDRNFHCWAYRRFVAEKLGRGVDEELQYTLTKIENNFSNYSAWHYRSAILESRGAADAETLAGEFELASNAFYTEPEDQSAWMYHRWLTSRARAIEDAKDRESLLERERQTCREVSDLEPTCKWPLLALASLGDEHPREMFQNLAALDPARGGYYRERRSE